MKIFLVLLAICAVAVQAKSHHHGPWRFKIAARKCSKEMGLNEEQIRKHFKNGPTDEDCFLACIYKELGILDDDNEFHKGKALEYTHPLLKEEEFRKIVDICYEMKGDNSCETAAQVHKCFRENMPPRPKDAEKEKAKKVCQGKLELSDDFVKKWHPFDDNVKEDCFGACIMKELEIVNEDGIFNTTRALEKASPFIPEDVFEKAADACKDKKGANECETAVVIRKCMREQFDADN